MTNKQTPLKTSTSLRYATPVGKQWVIAGITVYQLPITLYYVSYERY